MTQAEKLEALVRKAVEGGYKNDYRWSFANGHLNNEDEDYAHPYPLIFNHDFARALWNNDSHMIQNAIDEAIENGTNKTRVLRPTWEHHLQQAVISEDPIDYMYKAVFNEPQKP